jgi:hypothetical protein
VDLARVEASRVRALAETSTPAEAAERVLPLFAETVGGRVAILWLTDDEAGLLPRASDWCAEPGSRGFLSVSRRLTLAAGTGLPGTDGVTEARTADGRFGLERPMAVLGGCAGLGAAQLADRVERAVGELGDPTAPG